MLGFDTVVTQNSFITPFFRVGNRKFLQSFEDPVFEEGLDLFL